MTAPKLDRAVFLDRDGCVNVEDDYIRDIAQFRLYPGAAASIKRLNEAGFKVVIITNQAGIARGFTTEQMVNDVHGLLVRWIEETGAKIDRIEYCPHHPEGVVEEYATVCDCRKPEPGMIFRAASEMGIDLERSYIVGDKLSDIALGPATGAKALLVRTGFGTREEGKIKAGEAPPPDHVADGIEDAVDWILKDAGLYAES